MEALIEALKHKRASVREYAAEALGKIGDNRAKGPLEEARSDGNMRVREAAEAALKHLTGE